MTVAIQANPILLAAALRWKGSPFQPRARVCGAGVDCVQLAAALLDEAGLASDLEFPPYAVDFGDHANTSPVLAWFQARPEWTAVPAEDIEPGDVVLFRVGRVVNHVGVALGDQRFCHCLRGHGVLISRLNDPTYARRFVVAYSPPEPKWVLPGIPGEKSLGRRGPQSSG